MPKIRHIDTKGLVQESGASVTFEQGQITRTLSHVAAELTLTADGNTTTTDTATSVLPLGSRVLGFKVEVIEAGAAASAISAVGHNGDPDAFIADAALNNNTLGTKVAHAATESTVLAAAQKIRVTHASIADAAGNAGKVRVTVLVEQFS